MYKKRFSVIVSAYNVEKYIERAIKSILEQDFKNYEIIIINDNSTDDTLKVIRKYKDKNIKIINNKTNVGLGAVRNKGIEASKGEYIIHLDGDDTMHNNKVLSYINNAIGKENFDIIFAGFEDIGGFGKIRLSTAENSTKEARILCDTNFSVPSKCWRRDFLNENDIKFQEEIFYEDMVYSIKAIILAKKTTYIDIPLFYYYRNREGSIMSTPSLRRCSDMYRMLSYLVDLYDITPNEYKPYLLSFIRNETEALPIRMKSILKALKDKTGSPVLPKREYKFNPIEID